MKTVLVLTTSTGQGHNQAANSLSDIFKKNNYNVIKYDFLYNNSRFLNDLIVGGYELFATKLPKLYGLLYKFTDTKYLNNLLKFCFFNTERKLLSYIKQIKPDIIIGTHPLAINMLGRLKKNKHIDIPVISIVTDFKAHYSYISNFVDSYVTASEYTKEHMISRGITSDKIYTYGIPIKQDFYSINEDIAATKSDDYFNILLMSGSMGLSNIYYVLQELMKNKNKLRITVVCGKNEALKNKLIDRYSIPTESKKLHIMGFTNDISTLMDYCDVVISKPGGLTSTESMAKNIPMVIPFAIPGQEIQNTEFLVNHNCATYVKNLNEINEIIDEFIKNPQILTDMKNSISKISKNFSLEQIVQLSNNLISKQAKLHNF